MTRQRSLAGTGFLAGAILGALVWSRVRHNYRRQLFSKHPLQRLIALSYLSSRPTFDTVPLLRDYVRWESRSALRERGTRLMRRIEARVEAAA